MGQKCLNIKIELSTTRKTPSGEPDKTESESCRQFIYKEGISSATNTISQNFPFSQQQQQKEQAKVKPGRENKSLLN